MIKPICTQTGIDLVIHTENERGPRQIVQPSRLGRQGYRRGLDEMSELRVIGMRRFRDECTSVPMMTMSGVRAL
jgi:hypothetical protein